MKALVGTFNQEMALVGAFSVIVKTEEPFAALMNTLNNPTATVNCIFGWWVWSIVQILLSILYLDELAQKGKYFFQYTYGVKPAANSLMSIQCCGRYVRFWLILQN